jgi:hypothetical protein
MTIENWQIEIDDREVESSKTPYEVGQDARFRQLLLESFVDVRVSSGGETIIANNMLTEFFCALKDLTQFASRHDPFEGCEQLIISSGDVRMRRVGDTITLTLWDTSDRRIAALSGPWSGFLLALFRFQAQVEDYAARRISNIYENENFLESMLGLAEPPARAVEEGPPGRRPS